MHLCFDQEGKRQYGEHGTARAKWERQKKRCEVVALKQTLEHAVLPLTILTDNLGAVQGPDNGETHCTSDKHPNEDGWDEFYQVLRRIEK